MRYVVIMLIAALIIPAFSAPTFANAKYAGLVLERNRGLLLYEDHADSIRHPASLTKIMTLYMLFDAMEKGKLSWNSKVKVSARAASQPQTNISLKAGQSIAVHDLVYSLVVRSANDSAVVVAETLGKTEWNFARMMTQKAKQLGMKKTVFRNASGLPDDQQVTTARDMARLAMVVQDHFPQYYKYFKTIQFTYNGRTYYTHNKVTRYYKGADGLKTGYIRASGFNLITSAKRGNSHVIAVVMGGVTSKRRDNHMRKLLDNAFAMLEKNQNPFFKQFANYVPTPQLVKPVYAGVAPDRAMEATQLAELMDTVAQDTLETTQPSAAENDIPTPLAKPERNIVMATASNAQPFVPPSAKPIVPQGRLLPVSLKQPTNSKTSIHHYWGIQVGTFGNPKDAMMAAANAVNNARSELQSASIKIANYGTGKSTIHRARLANLTEAQARRACRSLNAKKEPCFVYKANPSNEEL